MFKHKHIPVTYFFHLFLFGITLLFTLMKFPVTAKAAEPGTETPLHVYFNFYDSSSGDIDHTIGLYSMEVTAVVIGGYIEAEINQWPAIWDLQEVDGYPQVLINYGDVSGREVNITEECHYDPENGFIQIPVEYMDSYLTVKCIMSEQSAAYQMLVPDKYKVIKTKAPLLRIPASNTSEFEVLDGSCNQTAVKGDFSSYNVGDQISIENAYVQTLNKYEAPELYDQTGTGAYLGYKGEFIGYAISFDCGTDSPFSNIGNTGTAGTGKFPTTDGTYISVDYTSRQWMYARCITSDANLFDGNPKFTGGKIYITDIDDEGTITCWVEIYLSGPKGQAAQNVGMYFEIHPENLPSLTITKKDSETGRLLPGAKFALWAHDGTAYNNKLGYFTDNQDGTYTFSNISMENVYEQRFLIKEETPPPGYNTPYIFSNLMDKMLYNAQKGRPIQYSDGKWTSLAANFDVFLNSQTGINLIINKTIYREDLLEAHGEPTFLFTVSGTDLSGNAHTWQKAITFSKEYTNAYKSTDGSITRSVTLGDIPAGTYYIRELPVSRFTLTNVTAQTSNITILKVPRPGLYGSIQPINVSVKAELQAENGEVTFFNRKLTWDKMTHTDVAVNEFSLSTS